MTKSSDKMGKVTTGAAPIEESDHGFHYARRGSTVNVQRGPTEIIQGYDVERMRARTFLTAEEEKKLMRRVDWRLMVRYRSPIVDLD